MTLTELEEALAADIKAAQAIALKAVDEKRDLTDNETAEIETLDAAIEEKRAQVDKSKKSADLVKKMTSIEVKEPEPAPSGDAAVAGGIGERFVKSAAFKAFRDNHPSGTDSGTPVRIDVKGVGGIAELGIGTKATITTQTGYTGPVREPSGYYNGLPGDEPLTFLSLVTTGQTNVPYAEYARLVSENDNAAVVAEGELKPLSDLTTAPAESKAYTYADGFDITNQTLADDGALAAIMDQRIRQHVLGVVEDKALNGTGAGTEPEGILSTTGVLSQAFDTDAVTTLARALGTFETNNKNATPQAIVMHPTDVWNLRLLKDANGNYLLGNPLQQGPIPTPWGVPLVRSNRVTAGTALVGRFDSFHFLELEPLNVLAFNQHKDYAQRNMVYVRAEMRGRQLFYAPREVVVATLAAA